MQTVVEAIHLDVLSPDYYKESTTPVKFTGTWPESADFVENFDGKEAIMTDSMGEVIGSIEYSFFNRNTDPQDYTSAYDSFGPSGRWNVVYLSYVHINEDWRGRRTALLDDPESSVSFVTLMVTEFLRQAMARPEVDKAFLYIASAKPDAAFTAYVNAGLYNNLIVTEKLFGRRISIHYDIRVANKQDLVLNKTDPGAKRVKRTYSIVKDEDQIPLFETMANNDYEVIQTVPKPAGDGHEEVKYVLKSKGRPELTCTVMIGEFLISASVTHNRLIVDQPKVLPEMYYFLLSFVIRSLAVQYGTSRQVSFSFTEDIIPTPAYIVAIMNNNFIQELEVVSDRIYNATLYDREKWKTKYGETTEEYFSHMKYMRDRTQIEVSFDLHRCNKWTEELKKHIDEYFQIYSGILSAQGTVSRQLIKDPGDIELEKLQKDLEEDAKFYETQYNDCKNAYYRILFGIEDLKKHSKPDQILLDELKDREKYGDAEENEEEYEEQLLDRLTKRMEFLHPGQTFNPAEYKVFYRDDISSNRTVTKKDLPTKKRK